MVRGREALPWVVFPVVQLPLFAFVPVLVDLVSPVDTGAEHRGQQHRCDEQHDDAREGHARTLYPVGPWRAVLP